MHHLMIGLDAAAFPVLGRVLGLGLVLSSSYLEERRRRVVGGSPTLNHLVCNPHLMLRRDCMPFFKQPPTCKIELATHDPKQHEAVLSAILENSFRTLDPLTTPVTASLK